MFCKMIAKDFKKLEGKWTYKVFMVGGAVFYEAPCMRECYTSKVLSRPPCLIAKIRFEKSVQLAAQ